MNEEEIGPDDFNSFNERDVWSYSDLYTQPKIGQDRKLSPDICDSFREIFKKKIKGKIDISILVERNGVAFYKDILGSEIDSIPTINDAKITRGHVKDKCVLVFDDSCSKGEKIEGILNQLLKFNARKIYVLVVIANEETIERLSRKFTGVTFICQPLPSPFFRDYHWNHIITHLDSIHEVLDSDHLKVTARIDRKLDVANLARLFEEMIPRTSWSIILDDEGKKVQTLNRTVLDETTATLAINFISHPLLGELKQFLPFEEVSNGKLEMKIYVNNSGTETRLGFVTIISTELKVLDGKNCSIKSKVQCLKGVGNDEISCRDCGLFLLSKSFFKEFYKVLTENFKKSGINTEILDKDFSYIEREYGLKVDID